MNRIILIGNIVRDFDLRETKSGKKVANFDLAVKRPFSKEAVADFMHCVIWDKRVITLSKYTNRVP